MGRKGQCKCGHMRGEHYNQFSGVFQETYECKECKCKQYHHNFKKVKGYFANKGGIMEEKTVLQKIRMVVELRRRGFSLDMENCREESKEYFRGSHSAMLELLRKLEKMKYIDDYIMMKADKYMSEEEKKIWKTYTTST